MTVAYETWGTLDARRVERGARAARAHRRQPRGRARRARATATPGGGTASSGPGAPIDTDRFFVVCPNVLGGCQGTTGPASATPATAGRTGRASRRSRSATRSRSRPRSPTRSASTRWDAVVGGSMGGMRVLEWAVGVPRRVSRARSSSRCGAAGDGRADRAVLACRSARSRPTRSWRGGDYYDAEPGDGPHAGSSIARGIGQISYRTELELAAAVRPRPPGRRGAVRRRPVRGRVVPRVPRREARRAASTPTPTSCCREAMNHHDVGRGRGGIAAALAASPRT